MNHNVSMSVVDCCSKSMYNNAREGSRSFTFHGSEVMGRQLQVTHRLIFRNQHSKICQLSRFVEAIYQ